MGSGVNDRHLAILRRLLDLGLRPGSNVLEAGCGTGPVSQLIAAVLDGDGVLVAFDIDAESAAVASARLASWPNARIETADALTFSSELFFHLIVLPDVIEHINPAQRVDMVANLARMLRPDGMMLLNTPNPVYLDWLRQTDPTALQPIDVPVDLAALAACAAGADLFVHQIETYRIWDANYDYQAIVLRPLAAASSFA